MSGKSPLVSVALASYNQPPFIKETLESVTGHGYPHWELLVVDDGSEDNSWANVRAFMDRSPDLRVIAHIKVNWGLADSRNAVLQHVRGKWVAMLDIGDLCGKMYFRRVTEMASLDADIVPDCMVNFDAFSST